MTELQKPIQLFSSVSEGVSKCLIQQGYSSRSKVCDLMDGIKEVCVQGHNKLVERMTFFDMSQTSGETFVKFLTRLRGQSKHAEFLLKCGITQSCCAEEGCQGGDISYADELIFYQAIRGLHKEEFRQEVMKSYSTEEDSSKFTLARLSKLITSLEKAGESASQLKTGTGGLNKLSGYQRDKDQKGGKPGKPGGGKPGGGKPGGGKPGGGKSQTAPTPPCLGCDSQDHKPDERRKKCPTQGKTCSKCGIMHHFPAVCRSHKKPEVKAAVNEVVTTVDITELGTNNALTAGSESEGSFYSICGISNLSGSAFPHHIFDQFGKWTHGRIRDHGKVRLSVKSCDSAYKELGLP